MKLFTLGLIAISMTPMAAIAEPLNLPLCYMITLSGRVIDLTSMCVTNVPKPQTSTTSDVTADDICGLAASQRLAATNQFQANEADKILNICQNDRARVERAARFK